MASYALQNLQRVRVLIDEAQHLDDRELNAWRQRATLAVAAIYGDPSPQLQRFEKIRWTLGVFTENTPDSAFQSAQRGGLRRSVEMLEAIAEDVDAHIASPTLPPIGTAELHPWVTEASAQLWANGHDQQAVQAAAAAVEARLRAKVSVHQGSAASLAAAVFSIAEPTEGNPRLRFRSFAPVGSDVWKSAHDGAGAFGRGCMLRIRNLYSHDYGQDPQQGLEALAALSLFARWVDEAELVTYENEDRDSGARST